MISQIAPNFNTEDCILKTKDDFLRNKFFTCRQEPFFAQVAALLKNRVKNTEVLDMEPITRPNTVALKKICERYQTKYGISIHVVSSEELDAFWEKLKQEGAGFVGIILCDSDYNLYTHVCPLLCNFAPQKQECYILDVIGDGHPFKFKNRHESISKILGSFGVPEEEIFKARSGRQRDNESCRIGATTLLRNALLWIKKNASPNDPLRVLLEKLNVAQTPFNVPLEWSYTEQIYSKSCDLTKLVVIRDFFSQKKEKRDNPRTIQEFRAQHTKSATFRCTIEFPSSIVLPEPFPEDVELARYKRSSQLSYTATLPEVNRYLQEKGLSERDNLMAKN